MRFSLRERAAMQNVDAFKGTFHGESGEIVLAELARFCQATSGPFAPDPYVTAFNAGKQAVWLEIWRILGQDEEELARILRDQRSREREPYEPLRDAS